MDFCTNSKFFDSVVKCLKGLISSSTASPTQRCINIKAQKDNVVMKVIVPNSHEVEVLIPAVVQEAGETFIDGHILSNMTAPIKDSPIQVRTGEGQLHITVDRLGTISEGVFHNQNPFDNLISLDEETTELPDLYPHLLKIAQSVEKGSSIMINAEDGKLNLVGGLSVSNHISFSTASDLNLESFVRVQPIENSAKLLQGDVTVSIGDKFLYLTSSTAKIKINLSSVYKDSGSFKAVIALMKEPNSSSCTLSVLDLVDIIRFQSYKAQSTDDMQFTPGVSSINLKSTSFNDSSSIAVQGNLDKINLNLAALTRTMSLSKIYPSASSINLLIKEVSVGDNSIKVAYIGNGPYFCSIYASS